MKATGFKKGMLNISVGRKYELRDAIKRALNVNTDRTFDLYKAGKWSIADEKYEAINAVFHYFGITEWADKLER